MADRRPLVEGLKPKDPPVDPQKEKAFVYQGEAPPKAGPAVAPPASAKAPSATDQARIPLSTRIRADYSVALKRASLERQLNKIEPYTLTEIIEEALEPWLRANGYIT